MAEPRRTPRATPTPAEQDAFYRALARWLADVARNGKQGRRAA